MRIIIALFLISCVSIPVNEDLVLNNLKEIRDVKRYTLDHWGINLYNIESIPVIKEFIVKGKDIPGSDPNYIYEIVIYQDTSKNICYGVTYVLNNTKRIRAESIAVGILDLNFGFIRSILLDRYLNTDLWYEFSEEEYKRQYPEKSNEGIKQYGVS